MNQLQGKGDARFPITVKHLLCSMAEGNVLDIRRIMESPSGGSASAGVRDYVLRVHAEAKWIDEDPETEKTRRKEIKTIISQGIQQGDIAPAQMLLLLLEQNILTGDEKYRTDIANGRLRPITVLINKLEIGEISPQMTDLDPSTGSIVVLDVKNGDVLAAVGYPSYDNNEMVNNLNYDYFVNQNDDPTHPLQNRPFQERRAPGSTFKMITAIAALENGSITPRSIIRDNHTFTAAGEPFLNCWSAVSHGSINVSQALSVSCNYFFCEAAYRLGNSKSNNKLQSIESLNQYMTYFGLNTETGVEIGESSPEMSSPALKDEKKLIANPEAPLYERDWYDGDTVQTAIGQSLNGYTAANMAKYIMTLANRGVRYETHLVDSVRSMDGAIVNQTVPVIEMSDMPISDSTWEAVYQGMLLVTEGANGTGRNVFSAFPVRVAGKTGTAQQIVSRNDHSAFGGFAPYEDPQIAVYVNIPFGDTRAMPALASQIARMVMEEYFQLNSEPQSPETVNSLAI
jgi:cell division protein FtsI/penicillin-binding protein 2